MDLSLKDCPGCGGVVLPDATSCPSCGHALVPDVVDEAPQPVVREIAPRVQKAAPVPSAPQANRGANPSPPRPMAVTPHRLGDDDDDDGDFSSDVELVDDIQLLEDMTVDDEMRQLAEVPESGYDDDGGDDFDLAPGIESVTIESSLPYDDDYQYEQTQQYAEYPAEQAGELPYDPANPDGQYDPATAQGQYSEGQYAEGQYDQSQPYEAGAEGAYNDAAPAGDAPPTEEYAQQAAAPEGEAAAPAETPPAAPPGPAQATEDVLLAHAIAEESESGQRQSKRKRLPTATPGLTLFVYCPHGHRVLVKETHRGRIGKCPNCKEAFFVPKTPLAPPKPKEKDEAAAQAPVAFTATSKYGQWIRDVHLHRVHPSKLKLTEGSLVGEYDTVDLTFCSEHVLVATVFAGGGAFRSMQEAKKKPAFRQSLLEHLSTGRPFNELAGFRHDLITTEQLSALKVVQPALPGEDSLFADVLVFGPGRIAVRTPSADAGGDRAYLSFSLSQFRDFVSYLTDVLNFSGFGTDRGIPLTDEYTESTCHYSDRKLQGLTRLEYYKADPSFQLEVQGWKCQSCGMTISEDSRKKEKIGGKSESSIAKAKCPKCKNKFGDQPLYGLKTAAEPA